MSTIRQEQIQGRLVAEVSLMLQRDLKDPRLGFITVTGAEVSRDLHYAKVFVTIMGDDKARSDSLKALRNCAGMIRGEFARRQHLRVAPEIDFREDESIERGARIFELLKQIETNEQPNVNEPQSSSASDS